VNVRENRDFQEVTVTVRGMAGQRSRLPFALVAAAVAAGAATFLLKPRSGLIEPAAVELTAYFSPAELDRANDFRDLQRVIGLGGVALSGGVLALLALRPPRGARRLLERAGRRPVRGGAATAAGLSVALVVVGLPLDLWAHERAVSVGLSTQSLGPWLGDVAKSALISAPIAGLGGALAVVLMRRFRRNWWAPASGAVVAFAVASLYLAPVLVDPLFNRFEPLPQGALRSEVLRLAERADVDVGEVLRVDASRRTTGVNAYVGGLGHTKRVVLYDNLIERLPRDQVLSVVAHELAHVKNRDIPRGILWLAIAAPFGMLLAQRLTEAIAGDRRGPEALPALALAVGLVSFALTAAGGVLSREVEARADAFALELTDDPKAFVDLERGLALRNVSDPDPPALLHGLFGSHPTTLERIGFGEAYRSGRRPAG
jgi:STE24 endopeptidase